MPPNRRVASLVFGVAGLAAEVRLARVKAAEVDAVPSALQYVMMALAEAAPRPPLP